MFPAPLAQYDRIKRESSRNSRKAQSVALATSLHTSRRKPATPPLPPALLRRGGKPARN